MMKQRAWVLGVVLAVACGGRARENGDTNASAGNASGSAGSSSAGAGSSSAGAGSSSAGAGNASAGNANGCPDNLPGSEPGEGAPCPTPGATCSGYGALSCPLTAVCSADSKWQINCPSTMALGPCTCAHHNYGHPPNEHRAVAVDCSHTRAASLTPNGTFPSDQCHRDSDCVNSALGENGRCVQQGPPPSYQCSYDTCFADSACAMGSVCQCRESADSVEANYCTTPSSCRIDADCGANGYCSPSRSHEWCGTFYACHTPDDECTNDSDCASDVHCDFDVNSRRWVCANQCGALPP